ncbi:MAG: 2-amino-4-hydroxy-6-hydroxymethyldihydropteridine diphosphokinase [Pseudomonadales bacterium]
MTHLCYLGLGSNINPDTNIRCGLDELARAFHLNAVSRVYQSEAVGFKGDAFLNLVVSISTTLDLEALSIRLREIEYDYGRPVDCTKFSPRTLDIDLLTYDNLAGCMAGITLPRPETIINAFVLCPFVDIAPELVLPGQSMTLAELWRVYDGPRELAPVPFGWNRPADRTHN